MENYKRSILQHILLECVFKALVDGPAYLVRKILFILFYNGDLFSPYMHEL